MELTRGSETSGIKIECTLTRTTKDRLLFIVELPLSDSPSTSLDRGVIHVAVTLWHFLQTTKIAIAVV